MSVYITEIIRLHGSHLNISLTVTVARQGMVFHIHLSNTDEIYTIQLVPPESCAQKIQKLR